MPTKSRLRLAMLRRPYRPSRLKGYQRITRVRRGVKRIRRLVRVHHTRTPMRRNGLRCLVPYRPNSWKGPGLRSVAFHVLMRMGRGFPF